MWKYYFLLAISVIIFTASADEKVLSRQKRVLIFQQFETLNLAMCLIEPIEHLRGGVVSAHRVALNNGLSIGFQLPYNTSQFTGPIYWAARSFVSRTTKDAIFEEIDDNISESTKFNKTTKLKLVKDSHFRGKRDVTAGEFYSGLRQTFETMGFHEQCVLKSICELASIPLHNDEDNLLHEVLHFVLTPSVHQSFDNKLEEEDKRIHEEAELIGQTTGLCHKTYPLCVETPLHLKSKYFEYGDIENA